MQSRDNSSSSGGQRRGGGRPGAGGGRPTGSGGGRGRDDRGAAGRGRDDRGGASGAGRGEGGRDSRAGGSRDDRGRGRDDRGREPREDRGGPGARERGNRGGAGREREAGASYDRRGPAGLERAVQRSDAPVRKNSAGGAGSATPKVQEPRLAENAPIDLPKRVRREVERAVNDPERGPRQLQHLTIALAALDERDGRTAIPHLRWLKSKLPRMAMYREALGVALYLEEDYRGALSELSTYRRLTGNPDQNHIMADAIRGIGEGLDRIPELVLAMEADDVEVPESARFEGRIVWASWLADSGDLGAGRAAIAVVADAPAPEPEEHHLRAWYVAGDLAERARDREAARAWFARIVDVADGFFDAEERLAALSG